MTPLTLRVRTQNRPPRPNHTDVIQLSKHYDFHTLVKTFDDSLVIERELVVRGFDGQLRMLDPTLLQTIALREER